MRDGSILRYKQTLGNYLKVSFGYDTYNLSKTVKYKFQIHQYVSLQIQLDTCYKIQKIECNDINNSGKTQKFINSTKAVQLVIHEQRDGLQSVVVFFCRNVSNFFADSVLVSFERTYNNQTSTISFYYNRFSAGDYKTIRRFRIQVIIENGRYLEY